MFQVSACGHVQSGHNWSGRKAIKRYSGHSGSGSVRKKGCKET